MRTATSKKLPRKTKINSIKEELYSHKRTQSQQINK